MTIRELMETCISTIWITGNEDPTQVGCPDLIIRCTYLHEWNWLSDDLLDAKINLMTAARTNTDDDVIFVSTFEDDRKIENGR